MNSFTPRTFLAELRALCKLSSCTCRCLSSASSCKSLDQSDHFLLVYESKCSNINHVRSPYERSHCCGCQTSSSWWSAKSKGRSRKRLHFTLMVPQHLCWPSMRSVCLYVCYHCRRCCALARWGPSPLGNNAFHVGNGAFCLASPMQQDMLPECDQLHREQVYSDMHMCSGRM
jgi:hypothetical protein